MLLKSLYDFALSQHLPDELAFKRQTAVRWIIHLREDGSLIGLGPQETEGQRPGKGREYDVPKTLRPAGSGQVADFLVDDIGAIFGLNPRPYEVLNEKAEKNLRTKYEDFWRQIREARAAKEYPAFNALLRFHEKLAGGLPSFLRLDVTTTPKWMIRRATGEEVKLGKDLMTFSVGNILFLEEAVREYWRRVHFQEMQKDEQSAEIGLCMVTGQTAVPIARTHTPMVTGLPKPAKTTGAGLVGFQSDSFRSYGFDRSLNAPTSIAASKAYLLALQYLSSRDDHWFSLGPAWLCFWTAKTEQASGVFARLLNSPDTLTVRKFMTAPWAGLERPPTNLEDFFAVTFTAAGPRLVVKNWLQVTVGEAVENFRAWFRDLQIEGIEDTDRPEEDGRAPLSVFRLACTTLRPDSNRKFDSDKLKPNLLAALYQAAINGTAPPIMILKPLLDRLLENMAKDGIKALHDESRFAFLKLILNRNRKGNTMEIKTSLTADTDDPAYNCGRLLSVFNSLQRSAHDGNLTGATLAERYFGSASTSPIAAFSILWRLHQHHLKKVRQKGEDGQRAAYRIKETISEICARFGPKNPGDAPQFPRVFLLTEQARFALGFYQQESARAEAIRLLKQKQQAAGIKPSDAVVPEEELLDGNRS